MNSRRLIYSALGSERTIVAGQTGWLEVAQLALGKLWVKSRHNNRSAQCPLYPQKRTLVERVGMSAKCQKRTHALRNELNVPGRCEAAFNDVKNTYNK